MLLLLVVLLPLVLLVVLVPCLVVLLVVGLLLWVLVWALAWVVVRPAVVLVMLLLAFSGEPCCEALLACSYRWSGVCRL